MNRTAPRPRTRSNSQYSVQMESLEREKRLASIPEVGALVETTGSFYVGNGEEWIQFAPINNNALQIGWARYNDTEYSTGSPYNFSTTAFYLPNDGLQRIDDYALNAYNGTQFTLELGATYSLTVAFKAHLNTNNGHLQINLYCPDDLDYGNVGDIIIFPKGNGVEHVFSRVFNFYANDALATSGLQVKLQASHAGSIYDAIYYIQKLSNA